jgi:hypothetical protein
VVVMGVLVVEVEVMCLGVSEGETWKGENI